MKAALAAGYRHIDEAWHYGVCSLDFLHGKPILHDFFRKNEDAIGRAIKESGVSRSDIWLTSKVCAGNMLEMARIKFLS